MKRCSIGGASTRRPAVTVLAGLLLGLVATANAGDAQGGQPANRDAVPPGGGVRYVADFDADTGTLPQAGLTRGLHDGSFYGATTAGGANGAGTVFRLAEDGGLSVLYSFAAGSAPVVYPLKFADDALWGVTETGGADGCGEIFRVSTVDGTYTDMYDLDCLKKGSHPRGGLALDHKGRELYGTTFDGGTQQGGTVYSISLLTGHYEVAVNLDTTTGTNPVGGLLLGTDHCFYGTTTQGGAHGLGTLFRVCKQGKGHTVTVLQDFQIDSGEQPRGSLAYDAARQWMVGVTAYTIFAYNPATQQFIATSTHGMTSPLVLGADGVTFYGTAPVHDGPRRSRLVAFDASLAEHNVAYLGGPPLLSSPLVKSPRGGLWGVLYESKSQSGGQAYKFIGD